MLCCQVAHMFVNLPAHFLSPFLINFMMDSYVWLQWQVLPTSSLGTPVSCSVGSVTVGGGGRQQPKALPPWRPLKTLWGCGGIFRWAGKCPHTSTQSHLLGTHHAGEGLALSQSCAERSSCLLYVALCVQAWACPRSALLTVCGHVAPKSRVLAVAEDAMGCGNLLF